MAGIDTDHVPPVRQPGKHEGLAGIVLPCTGIVAARRNVDEYRSVLWPVVQCQLCRTESGGNRSERGNGGAVDGGAGNQLHEPLADLRKGKVHMTEVCNDVYQHEHILTALGNSTVGQQLFTFDIYVTDSFLARQGDQRSQCLIRPAV